LLRPLDERWRDECLVREVILHILEDDVDIPSLADLEEAFLQRIEGLRIEGFESDGFEREVGSNGFYQTRPILECFLSSWCIRPEVTFEIDLEVFRERFSLLDAIDNVRHARLLESEC